MLKTDRDAKTKRAQAWEIECISELSKISAFGG